MLIFEEIDVGWRNNDARSQLRVRMVGELLDVGSGNAVFVDCKGRLKTIIEEIFDIFYIL